MDKRVETPYAKAWREWQDSEAGLKALAGATLGIPLNQHKYLVNRLKSAFDAGWRAGLLADSAGGSRDGE